MGSIDCLHWEWRNCLVAWKGQFTTGFKSKPPSMILEAVADYRLRIWHAYFGVARSHNDINVLQSSPLFNEQCRGEGPKTSFVGNGTQYNRGYYLADGIDPHWPVFVKTIRHPVGPKKSYFAQRQEDDEGSDAERWESDDGASSRHSVVTAPLQMGVPRSNEYLLQAFTDMRRKHDISSS
ncbi:uncharacterized protein LOC121791068 [Salvia splendens]|uniref:uncharacterized protein LOC121791068 n=1 Tax=Salvia splendens TaxID=180675 RepID=UPI001C273850|nr:uncharacterized protein LOC121791068 [Salvia splendens]